MSDPEDLKIRSHDVTDFPNRAPARAMLRATGMTDDDWDKAQVAVVSSWNEVTPCNMPLDALAKRCKEGVRDAGGYPIEFNTISVSDGISMGHEGMHASLVSREVIADSVETVMHAERLDAMVSFAGCDKSLPGMMMAAARCNVPAVFMYGGSILPGNHNGRVLDITSVFEAVGAHATGSIDDAELDAIERAACPTIGACAGMFTANTMASVGEAIGLSLPGSASAPAVDRRRDDYAFASGTAVLNLLRQNIRPRDILTKAAFENAIAVVMALGGSTNAVLHLLAIAHEARVELHLEDFNKVAARVPHLADTKPHGRYEMVDIDRIGGVPVVMAMLLEARAAPRRRDHRHRAHRRREPGDDRSARARRRRRAPVVGPDPRHRWHRRAARLARPEGRRGQGRRHRLRPLRRSRSGLRRRGRRHGGGARWAHQRGRHRGHPLRGTQGRSRHARDARDHRRHEGRRTGRRLRADHRRSLLGRHARVLHRPRRPRGGRRWADRVRRGGRPDPHRRRAATRSTCWSTRTTLAARRADWKLPEPRYTSGVLAKYAVLAQGAEQGAITLP